jgi:adenylate cyclase
VPVQAVERTERRLAAILAADVVRYSRLMGSRRGTARSRQLKARSRRELDRSERSPRTPRPAREDQRRRVCWSEFASVVDAVRVAPPRSSAAWLDRNAQALDEDRRIRISGRHQSRRRDCIEGDDIHRRRRQRRGAARSAGRAPGGICISRVVRDQVRDKLDFVLRRPGRAEPSRTSRVRCAAYAVSKRRSPPHRFVAADRRSFPVNGPPHRVRRTWDRVPAAVAASLVFASAAGAIWWLAPVVAVLADRRRRATAAAVPREIAAARGGGHRQRGACRSSSCPLPI